MFVRLTSLTNIRALRLRSTDWKSALKIFNALTSGHKTLKRMSNICNLDTSCQDSVTMLCSQQILFKSCFNGLVAPTGSFVYSDEIYNATNLYISDPMYRVLFKYNIIYSIGLYLFLLLKYINITSKFPSFFN